MGGLPRKVQEQGDAADAALRKLDEERIKAEGDSIPEGKPAANTDLDVNAPIPGILAPEGILEVDGVVQPVLGEIDWEAEAKAKEAENVRLTQSNSVLQGKYNSEIAPLNEEIRNLRAQVANIRPADPGPGSASESELSEEESETREEIREMYGDKMINWADSMAERAAARAVDKAMATVRPEIDNLTKHTSDDKRDAMEKRILKEHANWRKVNGLTTWFAFLDEVEEATGVTRRETVETAYNQFNERPLVLAMTQFKQRSNIGGAALETQVVPEDAARTQAEEGAGGDQNRYRRDAVEHFYTRAPERLKQGKMTKDEYDRLDRIYTTAEIEGRIVG